MAAMKHSLDYSHRALEIAPEQVHFKFNIAFVQIQLAQLIYALPENQRTLQEVQSASEGLDEAIESFTSIAHSKNPPYPRHDIEQRANMGRNTMRKQLERAFQQQREYEETNATKLQEAREIRETEVRKREEERKQAEEIVLEQKKKLAEERHKMLEASRELAERRAEEERRKEEAEYTTDEEGERVRRKKKKATGGKRKKKGEEEEEDGEGGSAAEPNSGRRRRGKSTTEGSVADTSDEERAPKKRRKLARKGTNKAEGKIKSSEMVVDSDDEDGETGGATANTNGTSGGRIETDGRDGDEDTRMKGVGAEDEDEDEDDAAVQTRRKIISRRIDDDDDEDEDENNNKDEDVVEINGAAPVSSDEADASRPTEYQNREESADESDPGPETPNGDHVGTGNIFADLPSAPLVDESVGAAGDENMAEY